MGFTKSVTGKLRIIFTVVNVKLFSFGVEDIFCSFIITFIFVVPCLHKHLGTGERMY